MNDNQIKMMRNAVGPAIFAVGAIAVVMVVMTWFKGMPTAEARDVDALARDLVGFMGAIPLFLFGASAAFLGARLFVMGLDLRLGRNLAGLALVPMALAIFLATVLPDGGGAFGEAIGGKVRTKMSGGLWSAVSFAFGVVVLVLPIWILFVREYALQLMAEANPPSDEQENELHAAGGLSQEEADALLPEEEPASLIETEPKSGELAELLATQKDERPEWLENSSHPQAASPYAEDVRQKGEIPDGATPLTPDDSQSNESSAQPSSIQRWAPENLRLAGDALGADLAEDGPTEVRPELVQKREPEPVEEPEVEELAPKALAAALQVDGVKPLAQPLVVAPEALPPAPSWEQSNLFEEPAAQEELELSAESEEEFEEDELEAAAEAVDDEEELEEAAEYEEEEEEEFDPAAEDEDELEEAAELEEEDELEDAAEEEEEGEFEEAAEYEEEDEEELEAAAEAVDDEEEDEFEEAAEEEDDELELAAEVDEEELEEESEMSAEVEELPQDEVAAVTPEAEALETEPEVVLTPQAPPVADVAEATPEIESSPGRVSEQVIYDAGVLFLERERVAVSMLQREFNLDFDESCETMDKLQTMGLIGPYVGGHRRDILLSKDEWLERVTLP